MELIYGRDSRIGGNLGDELNIVLWKDLFGDKIFQQHDQSVFLGIGSILSPDPVYSGRWLNVQKKIIFGTGVRPYEKSLKIDSSYDVFFLRGPLSAGYLGLPYKLAVTDAAYCMQFMSNFDRIKRKKKYKIGLIPHFQSLKYVDWKSVCDKLGYHFISPITESDNLLNVLKDIASCEYIIAEAMHGAIIADILRIPWTRFVFGTFKNESSLVNEFKWMDWMFSIGLKHTDFCKIRMTNKLNHGVSRITKGNISFNTIFKYFAERNLLKSLDNWNPNYILSKDKTYMELSEKLWEQIIEFRRKYEGGICPLS